MAQNKRTGRVAVISSASTPTRARARKKLRNLERRKNVLKNSKYPKIYLVKKNVNNLDFAILCTFF